MNNRESRIDFLEEKIAQQAVFIDGLHSLSERHMETILTLMDVVKNLENSCRLAMEFMMVDRYDLARKCLGVDRYGTDPIDAERDYD